MKGDPRTLRQLINLNKYAACLLISTSQRSTFEIDYFQSLSPCVETFGLLHNSILPYKLYGKEGLVQIVIHKLLQIIYDNLIF